MNRAYTNNEYADLWEVGQAPKDVMTIVAWAWEGLPEEIQAKILETQPVVLIDHPRPQGL